MSVHYWSLPRHRYQIVRLLESFYLSLIEQKRLFLASKISILMTMEALMNVGIKKWHERLPDFILEIAALGGMLAIAALLSIAFTIEHLLQMH